MLDYTLMGRVVDGSLINTMAWFVAHIHIKLY